MIDMITVQHIAKVAHEINRAYCASIGDNSQVPWDEAPDWQKDSAMNGVRMHVNNPVATPEDSHKSWLAQKEAEGWIYGEEKNPELKTHPCMLPYEHLPMEQRAKDYIFRQTVHSLVDLDQDLKLVVFNKNYNVEAEEAMTTNDEAGKYVAQAPTLPVSGRLLNMLDELVENPSLQGQARILAAELRAAHL